MDRLEDLGERNARVDALSSVDLRSDLNDVDSRTVRAAIAESSRELTRARLLPDLQLMNDMPARPHFPRPEDRPRYPAPERQTRMLPPFDAAPRFNAATQEPIERPQETARRTPDQKFVESDGTVADIWTEPGYGYNGAIGMFAARDRHPDGTLQYMEHAPWHESQYRFSATVYPRETGVLLHVAELGVKGTEIRARKTESGETEFTRRDRVNGVWQAPHVIPAETARGEIAQYRRLILR